ncbi:MAG: hypothetical protein B6D46_02955 [Polyangiaceae bacterium UTPRO1]|jgi:4-amino-4-deoxy-L-arabinose transferase-like glycosyltransferase|nr:glycosyltransferase family 39 protein [Myxococcales bacterium]OQY68620.1 MAG: hypothetical protein B6D46_02955 [Polyangiaceae bacterium UTPRO1]
MRSRSRVEVAFVAVLATVAQLPTYALGHVPIDEGQIVQIAHRLLTGERLYGDIYTGMFPGIYWLTAGLFRSFGTDVIVTRWAAIAVNTATSVLVWTFTRVLAGRSWAWLAAVLYLALAVLSFPTFTMFAYSSVSLFCALAALFCLLRYLEEGRVRDGVGLGALVVLCGVFKQNYGGILLVSGLLSLLWSRRDSVLAQRSVAAVLTAPVMAGLAIAVPVVGYQLWAGTFAAFLYDTLLVIGRSQLEAFREPIPPIFGPHPAAAGRFVFLYSPPLLFNYLMRGAPHVGSETVLALSGTCIRLGYGCALLALGAAPLLLVDRLRSPEPEARHAARIVIPFAGLFFLGIFPAAIWSHLAVVLVPLLIVLALLGKRVADATDRLGAASVRLRRAAAVALAGGALAVVIQGSRDLRKWYSEPLGIAGASVRVAPEQAELWRSAVDFLGTCARGDATIFAAPDMPLLYVSTGKRNPTPFDLVIPGNVEDDVIVQRLRAAGTRCVVYNPTMYVQFRPFAELFPRTAAYFAAAFAVERRLGSEPGGWLGLERKDDGDGA